MSAMFPDSGAVDEALVTALQRDAELAALMPDGVFWDVASAKAQAFVIVSLEDTTDRYTFGAADDPAADEEVLIYDVRAYVPDTSGEAKLRPAAARIHQVLQGGLLTINGFECLAVLRQGRRRKTMVDTVNDVRWLTRGGRYQVTVQGGAARLHAWTFNPSTNTATNPGEGKVRLNNAAPAAATEIALSHQTKDGADAAAALAAMLPGDHVLMEDEQAPTDHWIEFFALTGPAAQGSWSRIPVGVRRQRDPVFSANARITLTRV